MIINYILFAILYGICYKNNWSKQAFECNLINLKLFTKGLLIGTILLCCYALILLVFGQSHIQIETFNIWNQFNVLLDLLVPFLGVALFEEILFRFMLYRGIRRVINNDYICIVLVAFIFSAVHFIHYDKVGFPLADYSSAFFISILMSLMYIKNQSLSEAIGLHTVWNMLIVGLNLDSQSNTYWPRFSFQFQIAENMPLELSLSSSFLIILCIIFMMRLNSMSLNIINEND